MKKNQKGSALLWALIVVGVLSILIAASLTIAFAYKHRAVVNNDKRQAYLTAKGFIEDIVDNVTGTSATDVNNEYLYLIENPTTEEYDPPKEVIDGGKMNLTIDLLSESGMGTITEAYIQNNKLTQEDIDAHVQAFITVSVQATYANQAYRVNADLILAYKEEEGFNWELIKYYQRDEGIIHSSNITIAQDTEAEFLHIYNLYKNDGREKALEYMKSDPGWNNLDKTIKELLEKPEQHFFDDLLIRKFMAYRYGAAVGFPEFNVSEVRKVKVEVPVPNTDGSGITFKEVDLTEFFKKNLFIQPKFGNGYKQNFIFANSSRVPSNGGAINLVFYDNHWYYIEDIYKFLDKKVEKFAPTSIDSANGKQNWDYLVNNGYFSEKNLVQ